MTRILVTLLLATTNFMSNAQAWKNISKDNGAIGVKNIIQDSKGRLFLFCPKGVYTSTNNGDNWSLLGRNFFAEGKKVETTFDIRTRNRLILINDTVYFFFQKYNSSGSSYDTYASMYFDEKSNDWFGSNRSFKPGDYFNNLDQTIIHQTKKIIGFLIRDVGGNYVNTLSFSDDGMKTWKSTLPDTNKFANFNVSSFDDKLFLFKRDSSYLVTTDGINFNKKKSNSNYRPSGIVNGKLTSLSYVTHYEFDPYLKTVYDSILIHELDTASGNWSLKSKNLIHSDQKYDPSFQITKNGILYASGSPSSLFCNGQLTRSVDFGKTWETINIKDFISNQYFTPIEFGDKTYILSNGYLRNSTKGSPTVFEISSPLDFGPQSKGYSLNTSRSYIGNQLSNNYCPELYKLNIWNGKDWKQLDSFGEKRLSERTRINTQNYFISEGADLNAPKIRFKYYLTKDEGINWKTINHPRNPLNSIVVTETSGKFLAASNNTDTIYLSNDEGNTWQALLGPSTAFSPENSATKEVHLDFFESTIYLFHLKGSEKRIYSSSDFGENWNNVTFDLPQNLRLFVGGGSNNVFKHAFQKPTLLLNSSTNYYRYYFETTKSKWELADSNYYYADTEFKLDTVLRIDAKNKNSDNTYKLELSYDNQNWFDVSQITSNLLKGDTVAYSQIIPFTFNRLGFFVETNYGLFFKEFPEKPTGLDDVSLSEKIELSFFPNPASDYIEMTPKGEMMIIEISDFQGKQIQIPVNWDTNKPFDVSELKKGAYIVKLKGNKERNFKLIKN